MSPLHPPHAPRPFLKWVGGKSWLVPTLLERIGPLSATQTLYEPFCGSGALSLAVLYRAYLDMSLGGRWTPLVVLGDQNPELVETFRAVQHTPGEVLVELQTIADAYALDRVTTYATLRATKPTTPAAIGARMIALNRTCFNGLYRQNKKGEFNVPIGRYANPKIVDAPNLHAVSDLLVQGAYVDLVDATLWEPKSGDVVYLDPPYLPISSTAHFRDYLAAGWTVANADALAARVRVWAQSGVRVLISDADTEGTRARWGRWPTETVASRRRLNCKAEKRGPVNELLVDTGAS